MTGQVKIFIGCGSGIATSNMAKAKVSNILTEKGIPFSITTGNVTEMSSLENSYDVFLVTTTSAEPMSKPVIPVFGLLSGLGADEAAQQVIDACNAVLAG